SGPGPVSSSQAAQVFSSARMPSSLLRKRSTARGASSPGTARSARNQPRSSPRKRAVTPSSSRRASSSSRAGCTGASLVPKTRYQRLMVGGRPLAAWHRVPSRKRLELQHAQERDEVLLLVRAQLQLQDQVEELDGVLQGEEPAVV